MQENQEYILLLREKRGGHSPSPQKRPTKGQKKSLLGWKRAGICVGAFFLFLIITVFSTCHMLLNGPSESMRNALVLSAKQASATKWLPGLFLSQETIAKIEQDSKTINYDIQSIEDVPGSGGGEDEWADAIDGMKLIYLTKPTFKAYLLMVRDPSRVFVGTTPYMGSQGINIFDITARYNAVAAINGGEFPDGGGQGTGHMPIGITYSQGKIANHVINGTYQYCWGGRSFIGITKDNKLIAREGISIALANELGIRDGVCFQTGNTLITNDGTNVTYHYAQGDVGAAQRTCIGQRADGTILMLVTDGRTASSIGATHNDLIEILRDYGAIVAGKLDGGSSAMMYYKNYFDLYPVDVSSLDEYQRRGLVNSYKAFTSPRRMPTYFLVGEAKS